MTEISFETPKAHKDYEKIEPTLTIIIKGEEKVNAVWEVTLDYDDGATYFYGRNIEVEMLREVLINICQGWDYGAIE